MGRLNEPSSEGSGTFRTIDQMLDECDRLNAKPWVIVMDRWYYVVPAASAKPASPGVEATPATLAHITFISGGGAIEARARADGTWEQRWQPEPGETEWIARAVVEYGKRFPEMDPLRADQDHFRKTMARWSAAKPWQRDQAA